MKAPVLLCLVLEGRTPGLPWMCFPGGLCWHGSHPGLWDGERLGSSRSRAALLASQGSGLLRAGAAHPDMGQELLPELFACCRNPAGFSGQGLTDPSWLRVILSPSEGASLLPTAFPGLRWFLFQLRVEGRALKTNFPSNCYNSA